MAAEDILVPMVGWKISFLLNHTPWDKNKHYTLAVKRKLHCKGYKSLWSVFARGKAHTKVIHEYFFSGII